MTANLAIALYTPPVGGTLFVAAKLAGAGIGEITKALWPLLVAAVVVLFIITYVPSMTTRGVAVPESSANERTPCCSAASPTT